jgi:hypothetical protein
MVAKRRGVNATRSLRRIKKFIPRIIIVIVRLGLSGLRRTLARNVLYERAAFHAARHQQLFLR